ncbi:MAG: hypothetical protein CVU46_11540 [Chloroflexi bacterium HGW-Chloroflexi-8]|nr:MAG: hypothetical protein CVU46_11540 [Chloroflexi bacterium HGW-Chloroflexi-8]
MKKYLFVTISFVILTLFVSCSKPKSIQIKSAWMKPGITGNTTAAYFIIDNPLDQQDRLLSMTSKIAGNVELHQTTMNNGNMSMGLVESVDIPAHSKIEFKPQGLHAMFIDLHEDLKVGDKVETEFNFEKTGTITIIVEIKEPNF